MCSEFLWPPSLLLTAAERWGENEICTKEAVDGQRSKIRKGVGEVGE